MEDGVIERCDKKLNDVKGDEVVVIDGAEVEPVVVGEVQVEAEVHVEGEVQVEGEVNVEEAKVQVEGQADVEPQVQLDEEGLVEVEVQVEDEAGGVGEMEVVVQCMDDIDVGVDKYDDDVESKESDEDYVGEQLHSSVTFPEDVVHFETFEIFDERLCYMIVLEHHCFIGLVCVGNLSLDKLKVYVASQPFGSNFSCKIQTCNEHLVLCLIV